MKLKITTLCLLGILAACDSNNSGEQIASDSSDKILLSHNVFKDTILSEPPGQACVSCHTSTVGFTDFTYDNLGTPANLENLFYHVSPEFNPDGVSFVDTGLGRATADITQNGKFKVQTLRNIAVTGPYMHTGHTCIMVFSKRCKKWLISTTPVM